MSRFNNEFEARYEIRTRTTTSRRRDSSLDWDLFANACKLRANPCQGNHGAEIRRKLPTSKLRCHDKHVRIAAIDETGPGQMMWLHDWKSRSVFPVYSIHQELTEWHWKRKMTEH